MEELSNLLKESSDSNTQQPQHLYRLRGVATDSHTTYFLHGKPGAVADDVTETQDGLQWWMTRYDIKPEITKQVRFPCFPSKRLVHPIIVVAESQATDPTACTETRRRRSHQSRRDRGQRSPPRLRQQQSTNASRRRRGRLLSSVEGKRPTPTLTCTPHNH